MIPPLYQPPDVDEANKLWRACCGHAALAAVLRCPVMHLRRAFPWCPKEPWTSPSRLRMALEHLGVNHRIGLDWSPLPEYGLAFVQFTGPWMKESVARQYARTHVIGVASRGGHRFFYDVNAIGGVGGWETESDWECTIAPILADGVPDGDEKWQMRRGIEILAVPSINGDGPVLIPPSKPKTGPQLGFAF